MAIEWITRDFYFEAGSLGYLFQNECVRDDTAEKVSRVVFVGIYNSPATVTSLKGDIGGGAVDFQDLRFVRADANGNWRQEIWWAPDTPPGDFELDLVLSQSCDSSLGIACFLYCGGIGAQDVATGTGNPATLSITPRESGSFVMSAAVFQTVSGVTHADGQLQVWQNGVAKTAGALKGPIATPASTNIQFNNIGVSDLWVQSAIELLTYKSASPAIMGSGM